MLNLKDQKDLTGYTVIIPSVSVGNVPQLTIDLLISSYGLTKFSTIWHPAIISSVGGDPYESNNAEICTACELYLNDTLKLATIQLRSTLNYKIAQSFFNSLKDNLQQLKVQNVVILSSAFDYELHVVTSDKFYHVTNNLKTENLEKFKIKPLEQSDNGQYVVNGGGFGMKLYDILKGSFNTTNLIKFCSEGDNRPDAVMMLDKLLAILGGISRSDVKYPTSWNFVFGGAPPVGMY